MTAETLIHHGGLSGPIGPEISSDQLKVAVTARAQQREAFHSALHFEAQK